MHWIRSVTANRPLDLGTSLVSAPQVEAVQTSVADDVRLFATTFAAGFLFVSLIIA
jgi:hypothetical protein